MTVLVESYRLAESKGVATPECYECEYPPAWEVRQQVNRGSRGLACSQHIDRVLFLVDRGLIPNKVVKTRQEEG